MLKLDFVCDGKNRVSAPGAPPAHNIHFTLADTPGNRQFFGGGLPRGELVLAGIAEDAYVYEQNHQVTVNSASELQQQANQQQTPHRPPMPPGQSPQNQG